MLKTRREKLLAAFCATALLIGAGWDMVARVIAGPFQSRKLAIARLDRQLDEQEMEYQGVLRATRDMEQRRAESLPATPSIATAWYQTWLVDLLDDAGWENAVVTPGRAWPEKDLGHRLPFSVHGDADIADVAVFLDEFHKTPLLHKLTSLTIQGSEGAGLSSGHASIAGDSIREHSVRVALTIEVLSLTDADLTAPPDFGALPMTGATPPVDGELTQVWKTSDWFARPTVARLEAPMVPAADRPAAKPVDPASQVQLVASLFDGTRREAWLFDARSQKTIVLNEQNPFRVAGFSGRVAAIHSDSVTLELDGGRIVALQLGNLMSQLRP